MGELIGTIIAVVVIGYLIGVFGYLFLDLLRKVIYFFKWLGMTPREREKEKKRKRRSNYNTDSGSSGGSWWDFSSGSDSGGDSGGDGGGGGGGD